MTKSSSESRWEADRASRTARPSPSDRYLLLVGRRGEAGALEKVQAGPADLRVWRRDPDFREREQFAILHPRSGARCINLAQLETSSQADGYRRSREAAEKAGDWAVVRECDLNLRRLGVTNG